MPALELPPPSKGTTVEDVDEVAEASTASTSKAKFATGGIIYPPPDIRSIVDKTAAFVARNGASFESKIKGDERANTKFAFLNDGDAFNAYYRARIEAIRDGTGPLATADGPANGQLSAVSAEPQQEAANALLQDPSSSGPPEPRPLLFTTDLPNITAVDLDIVKLTALFVARKGPAFATALLEREARSYQFEFLRPSHSLFGFFNRLVEQYRLVLEPPKDLLDQLGEGSASTSSSSSSSSSSTGMGVGGPRQRVLAEARRRAEWEKWADQRRKKRASEQEEERAAFAQIDWQDFVVVSTVEITETDSHIDLPVPMSLREVENMTMAQKRMAAMIMEQDGGAAGDDDEQPAQGETAAKGGDDEMQMDSGSEDGDEKTKAAATPQPPSEPSKKPPPAPPSNIKIRKDYVPKTLAQRQAASQQQQTTQCPICKEQILTSELDEHVRIELLNPAYRSQRAELESRVAQQAALTQGADPAKILRTFAGNRRDIFGSHEQEGSLREREEEERRRAREREKIVWDGHAASRGRTMDDFNRTDLVEQRAREVQSKFPQKDTESIGPQASAAGPAPSQPQYVEPEHVVGADASSAPVSYAGAKRPAGEQFTQQQQPPAQRMAYEGMHGGPVAMHQPPPPGAWGQHQPQQPQQYQAPPQQQQQQQHYYPGAPPGSGGYGPPAPAAAPRPATIHVTLSLPDSRTQTYSDLDASTTVATLRDRCQADCFPTTGASRLKLKLVATGKMLTLKQTLGEVGFVPGAEGDGQGQIEVIVK